MKIFNKEQIYQGDKITSETQKISSTELMERAGIQIFNWLHLRLQGAPVPIHVFCGIGNNGGDGLVVARHLITHGYSVKTYIINCSDKRSKDFLINYDRIKETTKKWPDMLNCKADFPVIGSDDIIIDAVFGIGLNRPPNDWVKGLFQHFKASKAYTLSIDMPSGLYTDAVPDDENGVVYANYTLSFASPKMVFFLPETAKYTQQWEILDIGLDPNYFNTTQTDAEWIGKPEMLQVYQPRDTFSHKGTFGHSVLVGGSYGKIGAVVLSSRAALSSGSGLVTAYIPKCGYQILPSSFPEAMVITDKEEELISDIQFDIQPTAIGIGMGMGTDTNTIAAFKAFLKNNSRPLVIDADGINMIAKDKALLKLVPKETILTPHPKELERLIGTWKDDFDKLKKTKAFSKKHNLIIVVKGANTITIYHDKLCVNSTGNPGLATGGTGDVLTGIITGLLSQGYRPLDAAVFGVYLHGKSADIAVDDHGYQGMIASHVIEYLGKAFIDLFAPPELLDQPKASESEQTNQTKNKSPK